jgi:predicted AlkP superfamily phosphohydrolase/phosphomutase
VIGLDGATWDLLDPWIQQGLLPNIARLREAGAWGTLRSVKPPLSAPAWTSAVTGVNPGAHGVLNFVLVDPADFGTRMATSRDRRVPAIWDHLNRAGRRVGIVNIPLTSPADSVDGFFIGGFPHLDSVGTFYPPDLESRVGPYGYDMYGEHLPPGHETEFLDAILGTLDAQRDATLRLMKSEPWDFLWVVFLASDKVQHFFWRYMDPQHPAYAREHVPALREAIRDTWVRLDAAVGALAAAAGERTTVVLLSDHGFGPVRREFRVVSWMRREGYLSDDDWRRSRYFYLTTYGGELFVNDGRFPVPAVADSERAAALAEAHSRLAAVLDEEGRPVLTDFTARDTTYRGAAAARAPDLFFEGAPGWIVGGGNPSPGEPIFGKPSFTFSGYHLPEGILVASGPGIARGARPRGAGLLDVAPTLLYLSGAPIPQAMEGRVLEEIIDPARLDAEPPRFEEIPLERAPIDEEKAEAVRAIPYIR